MGGFRDRGACTHGRHDIGHADRGKPARGEPLGSHSRRVSAKLTRLFPKQTRPEGVH